MRCPTCGTQNSDDSAFCFQCGQNLNPAPIPSPHPPADPDIAGQAAATTYNPPAPSGRETNNPYAPPQQICAEQPRAQVPNYLTPAIILTVISVFLMCFCYCMTVLGAAFGVVAIVYANKVNTYLAVGNLDEATRASNTAKIWCWLSFGVLVISALLGLLIFGAAMVTTFFQDMHS